MASESVHAVAVVPDSTRYAHEHGWIEEIRDFEIDAVTDRLVIPITSVGGAVAAVAAYDVHVVRRSTTGQ